MLYGVGSTACAPLDAHAVVTIRNNSLEVVQSIDIVVSSAHLTSGPLQPGESVELPYSFHQESDYLTRVTFASGRVLEKHVGYVDSGLTSHDYLIIAPGDIRDVTGSGGTPPPNIEKISGL
jgi:hypothetical protein